MSTDLFCEIIAGERPATMVHSDEVAVSFLDVRPVFKGHVLVVPRVHVETLADLADVGPFFERVQAVARAVEEGLQVAGTFVAMNNRVSQSVAHLHVHIVPRNKKDGLRGFFWPRTTYESAAEAESFADLIAKAL
ncbi:HIT family protein [Nonomuraea sp. NPDC005650]|uniref:HIT family protein n=1 Tax=Nonomuraea sp. NPDC005650 TaxID=3157045 RepID=UPI0033A7369F